MVLADGWVVFRQLGPVEDSDEESTIVASEESGVGVGDVEVCEPDDEMGLEGGRERVMEAEEVAGDFEEPVTSEQVRRAFEIEQMAENMYMDAFEEEEDDEDEEEQEDEEEEEEL